MTGTPNQKRLWLFLALALCIALAVLFGPALLSRMWSNAGAVVFARSLAAAGKGSLAPDALARAESHLGTAIKLDKSNTSAHRILGFVLWEQDKHDAAAAEWRMGEIPLADVLRAAGQARHDENLEMALEWYNRAIAIAPEKSDAYASGATVLIALGEDEQAFDFLNRAIALDNYDVQNRSVSAHFNRGDLFMDMGRYAEAKADYEWVLGLDPDDYWATLQIGALAWKMDGDVARAEVLYLKAAELVPELKWTYNRLGELYMETGRLAEARTMYEKTLALDPDDETARKQIKQLNQGGVQ